MATQLDEGVPAFRYRTPLVVASMVSFFSIVVTSLLPVLLPYAFIVLRLDEHPKKTTLLLRRPD